MGEIFDKSILIQSRQDTINYVLALHKIQTLQIQDRTAEYQ